MRMGPRISTMVNSFGSASSTKIPCGWPLAIFVEFVIADINAVEPLDQLLHTGLVLVVFVHEFRGEAKHVLAQRHFGYVGGARGQLFFNGCGQRKRRWRLLGQRG